jgi:tRNA-modifying protein YgfZ
MDARGSATLMNAKSFPPQILSDRAVVRVAGDGALAFLHNLLTADLVVAKPAYGALLSPQGKILHDVFVVPNGGLIWIDVAAVQAADLLKRLIMYRLRAKLDIAIDAGKAVAVATDRALGAASYPDPRLAELGQRAIVDVGTLPSGNDNTAHRIANGIADSGADIGSGEMFVHEANLDQLHGVSFSKGCYVGQEVVARSHHRSTARNRILPVQFPSDVAHGAEIVSGEKRIGTMLSSVDGMGLALLRLDRLADVTHPLLAGDVQISVRRPDWATFELVVPEVAQ